MKRAQVYLIRLFISIIIWIFIFIFLTKTLESYDNDNESILFDKIMKLIINDKIKYTSDIGKNEAAKYLDIVYVLPWYFLIILGCYCLGKLG